MLPVIPKMPMTQHGSWQNARATGGAGILPVANLRGWDHLKYLENPAEVRGVGSTGGGGGRQSPSALVNPLKMKVKSIRKPLGDALAVIVLAQI
jgi:hypothetical protein